MSTLHIGFVSEEYPPGPHGGTGSVYRDLCEGLVEAGHRATVIGSHRRVKLDRVQDEMISGVRVIRIPYLAGRWPHRMKQQIERWQLRRWLKRVHRETPFSAIETTDYSGWLSGGTGVPVPMIVRMHGSNLLYDAELNRPPSLSDIPHEIAALRRATHLVAVSKFAGARTLELTRLSGRLWTPIYNGIDTDYFSPDPVVPVESGLVVFVNTVNRRKGIEELLAAVNEIFPSRPHAKLVAIGANNERQTNGQAPESLKDRVDPKLRDRVIFAGRLPREEVRDWLRRAQLCVYPSRIETFGIAPVEAMSVGKAVIYTRRGPGPEIIDHGRTGLLCDPSQPGELSGALATLLDDHALSMRLGEAARVEARERFDKKAWIQTNIAFFEKCCECG